MQDAIERNPRKTSGRPGNPNIEGGRVETLRKELRLTQEQLAGRVLSLLGRKVSDDTLRQTCYRWERGRAARRDLDAIACVLGTTVAFLQGGAPEPSPDRVDEIEQQLRLQVEVGNPATLEAVDQVMQLERLGGIDSLAGQPSSVRTLAVAVTTRLEAAQITRQHSVLTELQRLTGWSLGKLQGPASMHGQWLLAAEGAFESSTGIVHGIRALADRVEEEIGNWLQPASKTGRTWVESDARVVFREDAPWFRVQLEHPTRAWASRTLSFVRCEPGETGLNWARATWRDRAVLDNLPLQQFTKANFVAGFDDPDWLPELRSLRLAIERTATETPDQSRAKGEHGEPAIVGLVKGGLDDLGESSLDAFRRDGHAHSLVVSRLSTGLWSSLMPHLEHWPRECWQANAGPACLLIELDAPWRLASQLGRQPRFAREYRIYLVEQQRDGGIRRVPWREDSVEETLKTLRHSLQTLPAKPQLDFEFTGPPGPPSWPVPDGP